MCSSVAAWWPPLPKAAGHWLLLRRPVAMQWSLWLDTRDVVEDSATAQSRPTDVLLLLLTKMLQACMLLLGLLSALLLGSRLLFSTRASGLLTSEPCHFHQRLFHFIQLYCLQRDTVDCRIKPCSAVNCCADAAEVHTFTVCAAFRLANVSPNLVLSAVKIAQRWRNAPSSFCLTTTCFAS